MSARSRSIYNEFIYRYGFGAVAAAIQDLCLAGRHVETAAAVPEEIVDLTTLVGPLTRAAECLQAYAEAGVTTVCARPANPARRMGITGLDDLVGLAQAI